MTRIAVPIVAFAVLAGCVGTPPARPGTEFDAHSEKAVFTALRQVHATDEQRVAIMAAYDESQPRLEALGDQAEELMGKWHGMDRRDPGFAKKGADLAETWGKLSRERMLLTAKFDGRVASVLKPDQWEAWQRYWLRPGFSPSDEAAPEERRR